MRQWMKAAGGSKVTVELREVSFVVVGDNIAVKMSPDGTFKRRAQLGWSMFENLDILDLQATVKRAVTSLLLRPSRGGTLRIIAGTYRPILSAYTQQKRMRQC